MLDTYRTRLYSTKRKIILQNALLGLAGLLVPYESYTAPSHLVL